MLSVTLSHSPLRILPRSNFVVAGSERRRGGSHQVQPGQHSGQPLAGQAGVQREQRRQSGNTRGFFGPQIFLL